MPLIKQSPEIPNICETIISSSTSAVIAIDANKKIIAYNPQAEELSGYSKDEMLGQTVAKIYGDLEKAETIYETIDKNGAIDNVEVELKTKDGKQVSVLLSANRIVDQHNKALGQVGYFRRYEQLASLRKAIERFNLRQV